MQITNANCGAWARFIEFHDSLNRSVKTITCGLTYLRGELDSNPDELEVISTLIQETGEPWGRHHDWTDPVGEVDVATRFFIENTVPRIISALEDCLGEIQGYCNALNLPVVMSPPQSTYDLDAEKLCLRYGWTMAGFTALLPALNLFTIFRHCVAHRNGRVSNAFRTALSLPATATSWNAAPRRVGVSPPTIPSLIDERWPIRPRHLILLSSLCYHVIGEINKQFISRITWQQFLTMSVKDIKEYEAKIRSEELSAPLSPEALILALLEWRGVGTANCRDQIIAELKNQGLWHGIRTNFVPVTF
jgi:hypothetical protein